MEKLKVIIASLSIAALQAGSVIPLTIFQYIERTTAADGRNFCHRYDEEAARDSVKNVLTRREQESKERLTEAQIERRVRKHHKGAFFARDAAFNAFMNGVPLPRNCGKHDFKRFPRFGGRLSRPSGA